MLLAAALINYSQALHQSVTNLSHTGRTSHTGAVWLADPIHIDFVTETFPPEVNGVAMTLGRLVNGLQESGFFVNVFRPRQSSSECYKPSYLFNEHLVPGISLPVYPDLRFGLPAGRRFK